MAISGEIIPYLTAAGTALAGLLGVWLGFVRARSETVEAAAERTTIAALARMSADIETMRSALAQHEAEIRRLEARIREMQTRGYRWYRWAHEMRQAAVDARARAEAPEGGWHVLAELPDAFDLDRDEPPLSIRYRVS